MVTDSPPDDGAHLIPCTDVGPHFSFTSCPHSSHGSVCTTSPQPHEIQDSRKHSVYPSPPPTNSQPKRNVPLPAAARQYHFGGVLDSPVVLMKAPAYTPWSPPPTNPTPTHALPPADAQDSSFLFPISEQQECPSPRPTTPQLLSPISPEWTPNRKPEDVFAVDDSGDCVLMSQPGAYDYGFAADVDADHDILDGAGPFGRPALYPLDIPMYSSKRMHDDEVPAGQPSVFLGFHGVMPEHLVAGSGDDAASPFEYVPPSPSSSRDFDSTSSESDLDDLDFGLDSSPGPSSHSPSPLRSFASLPSSDLDDLDLDMDLGPGLGMSPSPSRRSVASLPSFDDSEPYIFSDFSSYETDSSSSSSYEGADELLEGSPDPSMAMAMSPPPNVPPQNALCLDLPIDATSAKAPPPPSILDAFTPEELAERLPPYLPQSELDALLGVRTRARIALAECSAAPAQPSGPDSVGLSLDLELRRTVPRDAGEPRRRRKRAKALGREVDAIVGLGLGLLPPSPSTSLAPSSAQQQQLEREKEREREKKPVKDKATGGMTLRRDKAGLAGLASMPQLVARMILRRRERCVRGVG
ncbi:hypothetical protein MSAN_01244100 [Mycena sanguinolenta]|uniref:Uncharacterized protein n=1 Tax=Mycena sanguinolenta TaxID=230812 RepID=A0A8H7D1Y0_9AGAR|nr:hypothetical protein MSAN_01244100 [Mycena sanguinolenta]